MATLVFSAVGTLVGGPLGGAIGAMLGREVDRSVIGGSTREGPRLTELAVSSSSYGQPIARLFGTTRAAGTILWATDLKESSETARGGKGQPRTRQYSYSVSLAIALSSRPIERVGRIWADGNLLRGLAGDMKTGGTLRVHSGHSDQLPDPLLAAALGGQCPAHRGIAYAVLEDLQLGDFGNRIPALSFEVFADGAGATLIAALAQDIIEPIAGTPVPQAAALAGFTYEGGPLAQTLDLLGRAVPLVADAGEGGLAIGPAATATAPILLRDPIAWPNGEFGSRTGAQRVRGANAAPGALRYYDSGRDYQPGLQRAAGRAALAGERVLELPATLDAAAAGVMVDAIRRRGEAGAERLRIRIASLDPRLAPGASVAVSGEGVWKIASWEWRDGGVELELERPEPAAAAASAIGSDAGRAWRPADRLPAATMLEAFELPWDGAGSPEPSRIHLAVGAGSGRWGGAALYVERAGALLPIGTAGPERAITGTLALPLGPSPALMFEPAAALEILCDDAEAELSSIDALALAAGGNRLLVGTEIVQFMRADPLGAGRWRLSGLLRGRGATEGEAGQGHDTGARVCLLDHRLHLIDGSTLDAGAERVAAIGAVEAMPVFATVSAPGRSRRPPTPVHPVVQMQADGSLELEWTRRARGAWAWRDEVDTPLVEQSEAYVVGAGSFETPLATWPANASQRTLTISDLAPLPSGTPVWVRQIGSYARSDPLVLTVLA